jgi:hypothetical protein
MANFSRNMSWTILSDEVLWSFRPYKLWFWQHVARETENLNTEFKNVQQDADIQYYSIPFISQYIITFTTNSTRSNLCCWNSVIQHAVSVAIVWNHPLEVHVHRSFLQRTVCVCVCVWRQYVHTLQVWFSHLHFTQISQRWMRQSP